MTDIITFVTKSTYNRRVIKKPVIKNTTMLNNKEKFTLCPCGSGKPFNLCCQPYLELHENAPTAETLMRSRYTAFVLCNEAYLRYSWHPDNCPEIINLNKNTQWLGLKIANTTAGGSGDQYGEVEFIARNKINGKANRLHENSQFAQFENRWVYQEAKITDTVINKITNKEAQ